MPHSARKSRSLGWLKGSLGYWIRIAQIRIFKDFEAELATLGVTPASYSVMEVIHANPGLTQSKLASTIHLERSSMVPMLDKLEGRGLVTRQPSATDRRQNLLYLTEVGETFLKDAQQHVIIHDERTAAALTPDERKTLLALLQKIARS